MEIALKTSLETTKPPHRGGLNYIGAAGFEPTTPTTPKWYATKLRYAPNQALLLVMPIFIQQLKS